MHKGLKPNKRPVATSAIRLILIFCFIISSSVLLGTIDLRLGALDFSKKAYAQITIIERVIARDITNIRAIHLPEKNSVTISIESTDPQGIIGPLVIETTVELANQETIATYTVCGDGFCDVGENYDNCPSDAGGDCEFLPNCGNGEVNIDETCDNCEEDVGLCCGNGICEDGLDGRPDYGETLCGCEADCNCNPSCTNCS